MIVFIVYIDPITASTAATAAAMSYECDCDVILNSQKKQTSCSILKVVLRVSASFGIL